MKILGICHDVFICSACVVVDGVVVSTPTVKFVESGEMDDVMRWTLADDTQIEALNMRLSV